MADNGVDLFDYVKERLTDLRIELRELVGAISSLTISVAALQSKVSVLMWAVSLIVGGMVGTFFFVINELSKMARQ